MNTERDLDRLIDDAARQMAQHEPSDALTGAVMERISARRTPFAQRWLAQGSAVAAVAIACVVLVVHVDRPASPPRAQDPGLKAQGTVEAQGSGLRAEGPKTEGSGLRAQGSGTEAPVITAAVAASRPASIVVEETEPMTDSTAFDVIAPAPLEVDRLEVTLVKAIDPIEIAPLEIEPLSASDD